MNVTDMSAMILAGGCGERMGVLSQGRAKPNLPFAGSLRVIDFVLTNCVLSKICDIAVLTDYERFSMASYLNHWWLMNGNSGNLDIMDPEVGSYRGTADAIYQNIGYLQRQNSDSILILAADHIYKMDYRKMLAFHQKVGSDVTVGVIPVPIEQAHRFGIVKTDSEHRVIEFVEKPKNPKNNLVSMGIYIFNRRALLDSLEQDAVDITSPHDFGHAVIPNMVNRDKVFAYKFDDYWRDIGTIDAYYEANMDLVYQPLAFNLNTNWSILSCDHKLPSTQNIHGQSSVKNSLISAGCVIKGEVWNSILSPGVRVEKNALVRNSILMDNTLIGEHSVVDRSILADGVRVGEFCYIGIRTSHVSGDSDITVIRKDAIIPSHTALCNSYTGLPEVVPKDFLKHAGYSGAMASHSSVYLANGGTTVSQTL